MNLLQRRHWSKPCQSAFFVVDLHTLSTTEDMFLEFWARYAHGGGTLQASISNDGSDWRPVKTWTSQFRDLRTPYTPYALNLTMEAASARLPLSDLLYVRFRHTAWSASTPQDLFLDDVRLIAASPSLSVNIVGSPIAENSGTTMAAVRRSATDSLAGDLEVSFSTNREDVVSIPDNVTIPDGQSAAAFEIEVLDNNLLDGRQLVVITASADGLGDSAATLLVAHGLGADRPAIRRRSSGNLIHDNGAGGIFLSAFVRAPGSPYAGSGTVAAQVKDNSVRGNAGPGILVRAHVLDSGGASNRSPIVGNVVENNADGISLRGVGGGGCIRTSPFYGSAARKAVVSAHVEGNVVRRNGNGIVGSALDGSGFGRNWAAIAQCLRDW